MKKDKIVYYQDLMHCIKRNSFDVKFEDIMTFLAKSGFLYNKEASTSDIENVLYGDNGDIMDSWEFVFEDRYGTQITFDPTLEGGMPSSLSSCLEYPIVNNFFQADEYIHMKNKKFTEQERRYVNHTPFEKERKEYEKKEQEEREQREFNKLKEKLTKICDEKNKYQLNYIHKLLLWHKYTFLKNKKNYIHQLDKGKVTLYYWKHNDTGDYNAIKITVDLETTESEPFTFKKYSAFRCSLDSFRILYRMSGKEIAEHDETYKLLVPAYTVSF